LAEAPGEAYSYNDYALALYYDTLMNKVFEAHADQVLTQRLGNPLGFEDPYTFEAFGPRNRPGRLAISMRDFARFGLFILHGGRWGDEQLVARAYVEEMFTSIVPADTPVTRGEGAPMLEGQRTLGGGKTITEVDNLIKPRPLHL
jgi:CubicO group peptidase (beta-lactamase class C family)